MIIIKKDFVSEDTESYCAKGHKLSSGTAYYMESEDGTIYFGGKQCAEIHGTNDLKDVPDLTKSLVSLGTGTQTSGGNGSGVSEDKKKSLAISYLLLREEILNEFTLNNKPLSHKNLNEYYSYYISHGDLNEKQISHVLNLERYASEKIDIKLSIRNLSTCHAYKFILDRTEAHLSKSEKENGIKFVQSLRKYLLSHCALQPKQVIGLRNWIQYLPKDLRDAKLKNFD